MSVSVRSFCTSLLDRLEKFVCGPGAARRIVFTAVVLAAPSLISGFAADDHHFRMVLQGFPGLEELDHGGVESIFVFADGDAGRTRAGIERGLYPWWSSPRIKLAFWRPLAGWTHALDQQLWPDSSIAIHAHSIAWYALLGWAVVLVYRRFGSSAWVAGVAALIYMVDDARVLAVSWIAARNSVMSCLAAAMVLLLHDRWRRDGWRPGAWLAPLSFGLGLACGEATIGVAGYLLAHALFLDRASRPRRLAALTVYAIPLAVWVTLRGLSGAAAFGSGMYTDPLRQPLRFAESVASQMPLLLVDQFAGLSASMWIGIEPWARVALLLPPAALVLLSLWAIRRLIQTRPTMRFWFVGMLLSTVPACAVFAQSRVLFLTSLGGMALVAESLEAYRRRDSLIFDGKRFTTTLGRLAPLGIWVHLVVAPLVALCCCGWMGIFNFQLQRISDGIPEPVAEQEVTIVALPSDVLLHGIPYLRSSLRQPQPRKLRALYCGLGSSTLERLDSRTLVMQVEDDFVVRPWAQMFRDPRTDPFAVGDRLRLEGLTIETLEIDDDAHPTRVSFRFERDPEEHRWFTWAEGRLIPVALPAVGHSIQFEGIEADRMLWQNTRDYLRSGAWLRAWRTPDTS